MDGLLGVGEWTGGGVNSFSWLVYKHLSVPVFLLH